MKSIKLYNVIFPIWLIIMMPPFVFVAAILNLMIDGTVIYLMVRINKIRLELKELRTSIIKAWGFGMLADLVGMLMLLFIGMNFNSLEVYNVWKEPLSLVIYIIVVLIVGLAIYLFNYRMFFKKGLDKNLSFKIGMAMGIITAPWTFLIPTS